MHWQNHCPRRFQRESDPRRGVHAPVNVPPASANNIHRAVQRSPRGRNPRGEQRRPIRRDIPYSDQYEYEDEGRGNDDEDLWGGSYEEDEVEGSEYAEDDYGMSNEVDDQTNDRDSMPHNDDMLAEVLASKRCLVNPEPFLPTRDAAFQGMTATGEASPRLRATGQI